MRIGILSDIHGNLEALEAVVGVLRDKGVTRFVCCGDVVGYGPDPDLCVEVVRRLRCTCVAGNHDYGVVGNAPLEGFNSAAADALLWTRSRLTESNRSYLADLPLSLEDGLLRFVHSSPSAPDSWKYVLTVRQAGAEMEECTSTVCAIGHTHQQMAVECLPSRQARRLCDDYFAIRPNAKYLINAGSVGQPRDGDPRACCLLHDDAKQEMAYLRVAYDIPVVQAKIRAAGLPEYLASRLEIGR
jgi:predicted phosphodiesterase